MRRALRRRLNALLHRKFPHGLRISSMIDKSRFRRSYTVEYGSDLKQDDEELTKELLGIGIIREGRVFSAELSRAEDELVSKITSDISKAFNTGASCVYLSELYNKYQDRLAFKVKIFCFDVFRKFLSEKLGGRYNFNKDCVFIGSGDNVYKGIHRKIDNILSLSYEPIECSVIHKAMWYVPLKMIKSYLKTAWTKGIVEGTDQTYFYAPNFPVSPSELCQIGDIIADQLEHNDFITIDALRKLIDSECPFIAMNIDNFTTRTLCNSLGYLLKDSFSFKGSIISKCSNSLDKAEVFREFCKAHDELTMEELVQFASEVNQSKILWKAVFDVMVRVSQDKFVNEEKVCFDVCGIDRAISEMFKTGEDYIPLKDVNVFLHYPEVGYSWNRYLLESYAMRYSWNFRFMHNGNYKEGCYGAIVRRKSCIKNFRELVANVLASSDVQLEREQSLQFLIEKGYLHKNYAPIDAVILDAKLLRYKKVV